jgi:predicted GNAT superfamily acetyltransferase
MKALEKLQQDVWGWNDLDTTPLMDFVILKELGGTLLGAFEGERLVGFAFGFVGYDEGQLVFHSHMLAVHPSHRESGLGFRLKLAQRAAALERGFERITWTFDPLQSTNAHLNFHKLAVVANRYKVNFYGEQTSSMLHRHIGTDRLWVDWFVKSKRVSDRVDTDQSDKAKFTDRDQARHLIKMGDDGLPVTEPLEARTATPLLIDIPANISLLQKENPDAAVAWRNATRTAFLESLAAGYAVEDFVRGDGNPGAGGCYLLIHKTDEHA